MLLWSRPAIHRELHYWMPGVRKVIYRKPLVRKVKVVWAGKRRHGVESMSCRGQLQGRWECRRRDMKPQANVWMVKGADDCSLYSHVQYGDFVDSSRPHIQPWSYKLIMTLSMLAQVYNPSILKAKAVGLPFGMVRLFVFMFLGVWPVCLSVYHMCTRYLPRPEEGIRYLGIGIIERCESSWRCCKSNPFLCKSIQGS